MGDTSDTHNTFDTFWFESTPVVNNGIGDFANTPRLPVENFWAGWGVRSRAVREHNRWLAQVGPELMKLTWRDAYSVHAQRPISYTTSALSGCGSGQWVNTHDSTARRTIPSNEIITKVNAKDPRTGLFDHDSTTYVELGLFDMKPGWRFDSTAQQWRSDQMLDSHHVMVVNRRVFEPTYDIDSVERRTAMLELSGTRRIGLKLNLMKFGEFTFCRVQEVAPDPAPLPGDTVSRAALDTIVPADSVVNLTLGPGRAALLRITYLPWDSTLIAGRIQYSNQRKIVWDPYQRRFHAVYMKGSEESIHDSVCYRRSKVITDSTGSIVWEGIEHVLNTTGDPLDSIHENRHPSLTIRRPLPGAPSDGDSGTAVIVVWSAHRQSVGYIQRQILLRTIWSPDDCQPAEMDNIIAVVDSVYYGDPANRWGTPVISRADGAEIIAWSDSLAGIIATARVLNNDDLMPQWWKSPATYTDTIMVSGHRFGLSDDDSHGRYPSMPTFAHIVSCDSNVAIVWEHPVGTNEQGFRQSDIFYSRLQHTRSGGSDTLVVLDSSFAVVNNLPGVNRNPSISQHQDDWRRVQDIVTWESVGTPADGLSQHYVYTRSIFTETRVWNSTDQPDLILPKPYLWGWTARLWRHSLDWLYPNVASITYYDSSGTREAVAAVSHRFRFKENDPDVFKETRYQWAAMDELGTRHYTFRGRYPTNSETPTDQPTRHALLYESSENDTVMRLRTSREFYFAKRRPTNYTAQGRMLVMRMTDSSACAFSYLMADAWLANDTVSTPVAMTRRDTTQRIIGELDTARTLLRTRDFRASDSTAIGVTLEARFHGDTSGYWGSHVTYIVELMDSASGSRVHLLDSFQISTTNRLRRINLVDTLDLLSGTYYIRTRVDTVGILVPEISNDSRYPIGEIRMEIFDSLPMFKLRRIAKAERVDLRISAFPNPTVDGSEVRFTVPKGGRVRVMLSDYDGRYATTLVDEWMDEGRYAVEIDTRDLTPGLYVVQVHAGGNSGIVNLVVEM